MLPYDEAKWPSNNDPVFHGCRNRLMEIDPDFQPVVFPEKKSFNVS
jgi:hypothetical protein